MIQSGPITVRVTDIEPLSPTLKRFTLVDDQGAQLPVAAPGTHIGLTLAGESRVWKNAYSVVSGPDQRDAYQIIVRRVENSRGGSIHMHDHVRVGQTLEIRAPSNLFALSLTARKHVLIGGGIGLTPLLSYLPALLARGAAFELHQYCTLQDGPVFDALLAPFKSAKVHIHAGPPPSELDSLLANQPLGSHVYVCGPQPLMDMVVTAAQTGGWPSTQVHKESFGDHRGGAPFTAILARSGVTIEVAADQGLLEAIESNGIAAACLCRGGACGECKLTVLEGEPDHRDDFLSVDEKASGQLIMPCVSRAKSAIITLDL